MAADNSLSLLPGRNPTGGPVYSPADGGVGATSGANPLLPPTNLPATAPPSNPYGTSIVPGATGTPTFGANGPGATGLLPPGMGGGTNVSTAAASPIGGMDLSSPKDLSRLFDSLKKTYGDGTAHLLLNFLTTGAGFNQDAINNLFAAMQPQIERGTQSLLEQFGNSGNRFSSGSQIGVADFLSQVNLNEGQIESQMYEQSIQDYMNVLMGTGSAQAQTKANSPGIGDILGNVLNLVGAGAGAASAAGIGGTAGSVLDVIASLGGVL